MTRRLRKRFRLIVVAQIALLMATVLLWAYTVLESSYRAVPLLIVVGLAVQVALLLRSVQTHVDALEDFFAAVNYQDFTRKFRKEELDTELAEAFNRILERFQDARAERDVQASYLDTVVRHVPVPLFAARDDGSLSIVNHPMRRLTGLNALSHIDDIAEASTELPIKLATLPVGQTQLVQVRLRGVPTDLRVSVAEIRRDGHAERIYTIENLSGELTARESTAWRNLIRVLTHEMMNTLTPVTSLAQTASSMLDEPDAKQDIKEALATIERRGHGLMEFVSRYREFLRVPKPELSQVKFGDWIEGVLALERELLAGVEVSVDVQPPSLCIDGDPQLLEQVLINIVKNAREAMHETDRPKLSIAAKLDRGRTFVDIDDNGSGIPNDLLEDIFIPFFTTRAEGSGVGLSLSRQIMNAHGGDIVIEQLNSGTRMRLVFA